MIQELKSKLEKDSRARPINRDPEQIEVSVCVYSD